MVNAYIDILLIHGVQDDDAKHSRQTIIDFIREQEALQQSKSRRQMEGGRKRKTRRRKSRRSKSRRNKSRKSRRSKK